MGDFKPSPAQQSAIDTDGKALLISAAAGSGKTTVLVQRVMRLLSCGEPGYTADRLMVVTFTVAAAAKLKSDLAHELSRRIQSAQGDVGLLKQQRMLLSRAAIGTFDAFCKSLCTEFFAMLGIEPDFKVGERLMLDVIEGEAMDDTLNEMLCDVDFEEFARGFANPRSLDDASNAIRMLHRGMISQPHPLEYLDQQLNSTRPGTLGETPAGIMIFNYAADAFENAEQLLKKAVLLASESEISSSALSVLREDLAFVGELARLARSGGYSEVGRLFSGRGERPFARFVPGKKIDVETKEIIKQLRDDAKEIASAIYEEYFLEDIDILNERAKRHYRLVAGLCRATKHYHERLLLLKKEAACFDFYDLQHMTLELLRNPTLGISERYFSVMVDEYQDTNPIADYIYHSIVGDNHGALFMVGDVKQSIYGFNSARPDIFANRVLDCENSDEAKVIYLAHNYRSSHEVIGAVNDLFGLLMSRPVGGVDYDENNRLYPGRTDEVSDAGVTFNAVLCDDDRAAVVARCKNLIDNGTPAEDICVLLPTNKSVALYAKALDDAGMTGGALGDTKLSDEVGAMPLIALLRLLANPFSEVDLTAVLLSPLAGFSTDDLAPLTKGRQDRLILAMLHSENERLRTFIDELFALRRIASGVSIRVLLQIIYERLNAYVICSAMSHGASAAIRIIEDMATQYDNVGQGGLVGFVRRLNLALARTDGNKKESNVQKGVINVMTIHTSKGLEFPVCILADTASLFNTRELSGAVLRHEKTSIGIRLEEDGGFVDTPFRQAAAIACRLDLQSERMRLLYVATTRAKTALHIMVATDPKRLFSLGCSLFGVGGVTPYMLSRCRSFADYLLYFGLCHPDGEPLRELSQSAPISMISNTGRLSMDIVIDPVLPEITPVEESPDQDTAELCQLFEFQYPFKVDTIEPVKSSVTRLLEREQLPPSVAVPSFAGDGVGGAVRGSATHEFLQLCDLSLASQDLSSELKRLVEGGFMEEKQAQLCNRKKLNAFFASSIFKRISCSNEVYREYEFISEQDGTILQGIVDLLFMEQDGIVLLDYKTTRGNEEELITLYREQLRLYAAALNRRFEKQVKETVIYSLHLEKEVPVKI